MMNHPRVIPFLLFALCASLPLHKLAAVDYEQDIRPILEANCLDCHGPDKDKSGFRVDQRAIMIKGGDTGFPALIPGDWEKSYLMEVVTHLDEEMAMPPKGDKLSDEDIELLKQWIGRTLAVHYLTAFFLHQHTH